MEGEPIPQPEGSSEGPPEGAPVDYVANCDIMVEEPDSPLKGKPRCILPIRCVSKTFITYMVH